LLSSLKETSAASFMHRSCARVADRVMIEPEPKRQLNDAPM
jgi:hypothetical protein